MAVFADTNIDGPNHAGTNHEETVSLQDRPCRKIRSLSNDFDSALASTEIGKFHYILLFCCGLARMTLTISITYTAYLLPSAECDFKLSTKSKGLLNAIAHVGLLFSAYFWGCVSDIKGRKTVLTICLVSDSICSVIGSLVPSFWMFVVFRFLNGFFTSGVAASVMPYISEFHSSKTRSRNIMLSGMIMSLANAIAPGLAWLVMSQDWSFEFPSYTYHSWRAFVMLCAAPGMICAMLILGFLPESPKFKLVTGKEEEFQEILCNIYKMNTGKPADKLAVMLTSFCQDMETPSDRKMKSSFVVRIAKSFFIQSRTLFKPPHIKNILLCFCLAYSVCAIIHGFFMWIPEILNSIHMYSASGNETYFTLCDAVAYKLNHVRYNTTFSPLNFTTEKECTPVLHIESYKNTAIMGVITFLCLLIAANIVDKLGKKKMVSLYSGIAFACSASLYFIRNPSFVLPMIIMIGGPMFSNLSGCLGIVVENFPTSHRATAVGLFLMMGRFATFTFTYGLGLILESRCDFLYVFLCGFTLVCAVVPHLLSKPQVGTNKLQIINSGEEFF